MLEYKKDGPRKSQ